MKRLATIAAVVLIITGISVTMWQKQRRTPAAADPARRDKPGNTSLPTGPSRPVAVEPSPVAPSQPTPARATPVTEPPALKPSATTGFRMALPAAPLPHAEKLTAPTMEPSATSVVPEVTAESVAVPPPEVPEPDRSAEVAPLSSEHSAIQRVLRRYLSAFNNLDAAAAANVWPSVDQRALARLFARVERQQLEFTECSVALSDANATATCRGTLTYVPRVGTSQPRAEPHAWKFHLRGVGQDWYIVDVAAR